MTLTLLYFASLREGLGLAREVVEVPAGVESTSDLLAWLRGRGGDWSVLLAEGRALRIAVDQELVDASVPLRAGAEVAIFPPVTGG